MRVSSTVGMSGSSPQLQCSPAVGRHYILRLPPANSGSPDAFEVRARIHRRSCAGHVRHRLGSDGGRTSIGPGSEALRAILRQLPRSSARSDSGPRGHREALCGRSDANPDERSHAHAGGGPQHERQGCGGDLRQRQGADRQPGQGSRGEPVRGAGNSRCRRQFRLERLGP